MWTKTAHEIFPLRRISLKKWRISKFLTAQWLLWWKAIFFLQDYFGLVRKTILSSWCYVSKMLNCSFWQWLCKFSSFFPPCLFWVLMEKLLKHNVICIFGSYGVNKSLILMWPIYICSDVANITLTGTVMPLFLISFEGTFVQITSMKREIKNVYSHKVPICERLQCLFCHVEQLKQNFCKLMTN